MFQTPRSSRNKRSTLFTIEGLENRAMLSATVLRPLVVTSGPAAPAVVLQPMSESVAAGGSVSLIAAASGSPLPTVQWEISTNNGATFSPISGATAVVYNFTAITSDNGDEYEAVFTNSQGTATSTPATLTVTAAQALKIQTSNPQSTLVSSTISPATGTAPLTATATLTNALPIWLSVAAKHSPSTATVTATSGAANDFASLDGLVAPDGKAKYDAAFKTLNGTVTVDLSLSPAAAMLNLLDTVLPVTDWKASSSLANELSLINSGTTLGSAVNDLTAAAAGHKSLASAAHAIARYTVDADSGSALSTLTTDLKAAGVTLTSSEQKTFASASKMYKLAKRLITALRADTQLPSGNPTAVTYTAVQG